MLGLTFFTGLLSIIISLPVSRAVKLKKITETGVRLYYSSRIVVKNGSTIVEYFGNGPFVPFARVIGNVVDSKLMNFWTYAKLTVKQYRDLSNIA